MMGSGVSGGFRLVWFKIFFCLLIYKALSAHADNTNMGLSQLLETSRRDGEAMHEYIMRVLGDGEPVQKVPCCS